MSDSSPLTPLRPHGSPSYSPTDSPLGSAADDTRHGEREGSSTRPRPHGEAALTRSANVRLNVLRSTTSQAAERGGAPSNRRLSGALISCIVEIPQIVAGVVVLSTHASNESCKDSPLALWIAVFVLYLIVTFSIACTSCLGTVETSAVVRAANRLAYPVEAFGMLWLVIGNIWIIGADECATAAPHLYQTALALLVTNLCIVFMPCLVVILMIPLLCFCLPCVIRLLARFADSSGAKGASEEQIAKLPPPQPFEPGIFGDEEGDSMCAICLSEFETGELARKLPTCRHAYHPQCVDTWLKLNASCPTCRAVVFASDEGDGQPDADAHSEAESGTAAGAASVASRARGAAVRPNVRPSSDSGEDYDDMEQVDGFRGNSGSNRNSSGASSSHYHRVDNGQYDLEEGGGLSNV